MQRLFRNNLKAVSSPCEMCPNEFGRMAYLNRHIRFGSPFPKVPRDEMEVAKDKRTAILFFTIIPVGDIDGIFFDILPCHVPRSSSQPESLTLSYGIEPVALVLSDALS